jgi:hypothetical protein
MPAESKKQAIAARIALAARKGDLPKSKLTGASKEMAAGMSKKQLKKYTKTKPGARALVKAESFNNAVNNILRKLHFL